MAGKKRFLIPLTAIVILAFGAVAYFDMPIPSTIALPFVDEIHVSVEDLAEAKTLADNCNAQNYPVNSQMLDVAAAGLSDMQKREFNKQMMKAGELVKKYPDSVNAKECKSLNREFQRMGQKKFVIIE